MDQKLRAAIIAVAFACVAQQAALAQSAEDRLPELVAAEHVRLLEVPSGKVAMDPRVLVQTRKPRKLDDRHPTAVTASVASALKAEVRELESVQKCEPNSYRCWFDGVKAVLTLSKPEIRGSTSTVLVRVDVDLEPGQPKGQIMAQYRVDLERVNGSWRVKNATPILYGR